MSLKIKRVYEKPDKSDGTRILVDRLWPRGVSKEDAKIDLWLKEIAPSAELRKWFNHDPEKWVEFKKRYFKELKKQDKLMNQILDYDKKGDVTLIYSAKEEKFNNAAALQEFLENG